jgi:hypothetical protein
VKGSRKPQITLWGHPPASVTHMPIEACGLPPAGNRDSLGESEIAPIEDSLLKTPSWLAAFFTASAKAGFLLAIGSSPF